MQVLSELVMLSGWILYQAELDDDMSPFLTIQQKKYAEVKFPHL